MSIKKPNTSNTKGKTFVTESIFNAVKTLVLGGAKNKEISEYLNLGETAISRIRSAENYAEYKQILAAISLKMRKDREQNKEIEKKASDRQQIVEQQKIDLNDSEKKEVAPQIIEHRQTVTIQATHYMMEEMRRQNELLKDISAKLAFIVEQLA